MWLKMRVKASKLQEVSLPFPEEGKSKPQTLLFSATMPDWVYKTAKKYMQEDVKHVDLVGRDRMQTSTTVQVRL